jgi:tetratricopeptide (TPR) repeat protein
MHSPRALRSLRSAFQAALALVIGVFVLAPLSLRAAPSRAGQPQAAATVDAELETARQLLQQGEYFNALKGYQRASQLAGGQSADAFLGMALAMRGMKVYKNALDASQSAIDLAPGNARLLARAHKLKGQVLSAIGDARGAEAELRTALAADPDSNVADLHYELGLALLVQHRDEEAIAELRKEIEIRPHGTTAEEAQALIANPRRGREKYAPDFSFVSSDGRSISLEALRGRVVLLDFWASWCEPCVRALPSVKKVQKDHASAPFVVVGISGDTDGKAWRSFTEKNAMVWPQYWDDSGKLRRLFDVQLIPTYVLLDGEGIERLRVKGAGFNDARNLASEIGKQLTLLARPRP